MDNQWKICIELIPKTLRSQPLPNPIYITRLWLLWLAKGNVALMHFAVTPTQLVFACSKSTMETPDKHQSLTSFLCLYCYL